MATKAQKKELIDIQPIEFAKIKIKVVGDSPLIVHAWGAKAKRQMLLDQIGSKKTKAKEPKNPLEDFVSSMYWLTPMPTEFTQKAVDKALENAEFGFQASGFKQAAIAAAYRMQWVKDMVSSKGAFFIDGEVDSYYSGDLVTDFDRKTIDIVPNVIVHLPLVKIHSDTPVMREDMVRLSGIGRTADIRYRGEFRNWWADLTIRFNLNGAYSLDQVVNMIDAGGRINGIGEWRPEKDGDFGRYHVETYTEE